MSKLVQIKYPPPQWWTSNGLPIPEYEYKFHPTRRWRFDYYFIDHRVAIEIEGGTWKYGRHNRASSFWKDQEKYNEAVKMGIIILKYPSVKKIDTNQVRETITNLKN